LVELTVRGINPRPDLLAQAARTVPIHIVAGTGYYMHRTRPTWWSSADENTIALTIHRDIAQGFTSAPAVKAGIIGELAIEGPDSLGLKGIDDIGPSDSKLLRAAVIAQAATGAAISIHLPHCLAGGASPAQLASGIVDLLDQAGANLDRVILGHVDRAREWSIQELIDLAERGPVIEFDEWGLEGYVDNSNHVNPFDDERIQWTLGLAEAGCLERLVWSHDVYLKYMLRKYGGTGYAHIHDFVIPRLTRSGLTDGDIDQVMVQNPRRLLTLAAPTQTLDEQGMPAESALTPAGGSKPGAR
jgi:phosphotriesterase-related protein